MKLVTYFFIIASLLAKTNENKNFTVGSNLAVKENFYSNEKETIFTPFFIIKYGNIELNPNSISYTTFGDSLNYSVSLDGLIRKDILEKGELNGIVLTDRKAPLNIGIDITKKYNKLVMQGSYKRNIAEVGDSISFSIAKINKIKESSKWNQISSIKYIYYGKSYSNYYFNLSKEEYLSINKNYKENYGTSQVDGSLQFIYNLSNNIKTNIGLKVIYQDKNMIIDKRNLLKWSISTGLNYKF